MRLSAILLRIVVFAIAGFGSVVAARSAVATMEDRSVIAVRETLIDQGHDWVSVLGDGLQVILEGEAPSEAARFRAISAAGSMVDASRVIDSMSIVESDKIAPPEFAVEILRNDRGVSLIGLLPAAADRRDLEKEIENIADGLPVTDLMDVADYPMPETWLDAMSYAVRALELLPRSKISVGPNRVAISAIADTEQQKVQWERSLARNTPENVVLDVDISAPRPVISPFTTRFTLDGEGGRFYACAADTEAARDVILAAAAAAGLTEETECTIALGTPSRTWGDAASLAIEAISQMGGGTVTLSDTDVTLVALPGTEQEVFDNAVGELENALPEVFAVSAELPPSPNATTEGPPRFTATRSPEGAVQLRGRVPDDMTNTIAENYAVAKFGKRDLTLGTRVAEGLPAGWSVRVLAGIEALSELSNGSVIVEPDTIQIRGNTGNQTASDDISRLLIEKLGQAASFDIDVTYVKQLDPIAGLPSPEECLEQITEVTQSSKITFDPSSADITAATQPVVDQIADILRRCGDLRIRIAGYTDSQGREVMNQQLSQDRAEAVLSALRARRVPVGSFEALGFGEENPIADNDTDAGREANRRIEFSLIVPEPIPEETTTLEELAAEDPMVPVQEEETPADGDGASDDASDEADPEAATAEDE